MRPAGALLLVVWPPVTLEVGAATTVLDEFDGPAGGLSQQVSDALTRRTQANLIRQDPLCASVIRGAPG